MKKKSKKRGNKTSDAINGKFRVSLKPHPTPIQMSSDYGNNKVPNNFVRDNQKTKTKWLQLEDEDELMLIKRRRRINLKTKTKTKTKTNRLKDEDEDEDELNSNRSFASAGPVVHMDPPGEGPATKVNKGARIKWRRANRARVAQVDPRELRKGCKIQNAEVRTA